ncbi:MAG: nitrogen regulation protein NR(I) [Gammaproteobacteria bacterium]|jgi:two-component system nitrogen regulation response regulator GlnG|nr:nitrogen regulation protein NR(I) [Gammaproteobacteria bacterium]
MTAARPIEVWVVDDDDSIRWVLEQALRRADMQFQGFADPFTALEALGAANRPDVLITDIRMPGMDGLQLSQHVADMNLDLPIIVITAHTDLDSAVAAYRSGAFEYLPKPFDIDEAVALVKRAVRASDARKIAGTTAPAIGMSGMVGQAPAMQEVFRTIGRLSRASITVLITGESGTGKELVARALHEHSPRVNRPFVALNTTAIAAELLESELFGHERGAFTGADRQRIGRFEQADGGTLFLDEIGDMSADLQTRLLRVLAEGEFYRVGGQQPIQVDVRIFAATNQNLDAAVAEGRFREDLYHRLNVMRIQTPPLRNRREDIPMLLEHFLQQASKELGSPIKTITADALRCLQQADWPGNVRQLANFARRMTVVAAGTEITLSDIPAEFGGHGNQTTGDGWAAELSRWAAAELSEQPDRPLLNDALPKFERALITTAMQMAGGRKQDAAKLLGWGRNTLTRKLKELGL